MTSSVSSPALRSLIVLASLLLPWTPRRVLLGRLLGYELDPSSRIGWAFICPGHLRMGAGSRIGPLTVCRGLERLELGPGASIGPANWITGTPREGAAYYGDEPERSSDLVLGPQAVVGSRHYLDCTNRIELGAFSRMDGVRSVVLSHSVNIAENRQRSMPVSIGSHCLIGTSCVILPGTLIPDFCVIEAASLVTGVLPDPHTLYAGSPARRVEELSPDSAFGARCPAVRTPG